jgi:hypothetical protein
MTGLPSVKMIYFLTHTLIILSDNYRLLLPVGSLIVFTYINQQTAHKLGAVAAVSDKWWLSDKITTVHQKSSYGGARAVDGLSRAAQPKGLQNKHFTFKKLIFSTLSILN